MDNVTNFINSLNINSADYLIVACSSGPDSMMLLNILNDMGFKVVCAHVNHHVREESNNEYDFMINYCNEHHIIFEGYEILDYKNSKFSEEEARKKRYLFFDSLIDKYHSKYLFTAHHGDDLMETILMRLVRGSSIYGYMGFTMITNRNNYQVIRPLVYLDKKYILEYDDEHNIPYNIDNTNLSDEHTRNRFRHYVLPPIKTEDEMAHLKFLKYSNKLNDLVMFTDRVVMKQYNKVFTNEYINIDLFTQLDDYEQRLIVEKILDINYPDNLYLVNDTHTSLIMKLIYSEGNKEINLPNEWIVRKSYNQINFIKKHEVNNYEYILEDEVKLPFGLIKKIDKSEENSNNVIFLNSKDIKLPIIVRTRQDGDRLFVKNLNGNKKVNDIFIDNKISKEKRELWPVVVDSDNQVLWLPGLKKSKFDSKNINSYDIILKYVEEEEYE